MQARDRGCYKINTKLETPCTCLGSMTAVLLPPSPKKTVTEPMNKWPGHGVAVGTDWRDAITAATARHN